MIFIFSEKQLENTQKKYETEGCEIKYCTNNPQSFFYRTSQGRKTRRNREQLVGHYNVATVRCLRAGVQHTLDPSTETF